MLLIAAVYITIPNVLVAIFESDNAADFAAVADLVPKLLICVAVFSLADSINVTFGFALRGAGDTWFVSLLTFCLAWPLMVLPTVAIVWMSASVLWAWVFATIHILAMSACFWWRFRSGRWKSMRVIEPAPLE